MVTPLPKNRDRYERVRELRKSGMSQRDIANECHLDKGMVRYYTKDIILTNEQKSNLIINQYKKIAEAQKQKIGDKNGNYKGDNIGYDALHSWVHKHKPVPDECEYCHKPNLKLVCACIGEYKRDLSQFKWLCWSCQHKSDRKNPKRPQIYYPDKFTNIGTKKRKLP